MLKPRSQIYRRAVVLLCLIVFTRLTYMNHDIATEHLSKHIGQYLPLTAIISRPSSVIGESFIRIAASVEVPSFDPLPIQNHCSALPWSSDIIVECSVGLGGLSNVRQQLLSCIHWTIVFRAALIIPVVKPRMKTNASEEIVHQYTSARDLRVLFDREVFLERLREACPQLILYDSIEDFGMETGKSIKDLGGMPKMASLQKEEMQGFAREWLLSQGSLDSENTAGLIRIPRTATEYDICQEGTQFANSFGQIMPFRKDTRRLAAAVLSALAARFALSISPSEGITDSAYLGIHLRTSSDATKEGWMNYTVQAAAYSQLALEYDLPVIYVASGNISSTLLFASTVAPTPVVTKQDLLSEQDLEELNALTWDQQAQVDYMVLLRASQYLGMSDSNFSWAVAVAKRTASRRGTCEGLKAVVSEVPAGAGHTQHYAMKDELSVIIGSPSKYNFGTRSWP